MSDLRVLIPIRIPLSQTTTAPPTVMTSEQSFLPPTTDYATSFHPQSLTWQTMPPNTTSKSRVQSLLQILPKLVIAKPLQSFNLFSELPKELRDMVWEQVASRSRLIPVHVCSRFSDPPLERRLSFLGIPSILLVSREVRQEGLKYYQSVTEKAFHPPASSLASALSTSSIAIETISDSDESDDSDSHLIDWLDIMTDDESDAKVAVTRTVYLNFDRDLFSIPNIRPLTSYTNFNFDLKAISKIQRLNIMTTPVCGRFLVNENMLHHIFSVNSLRVVRVYVEHAWICSPGDNDFLAADSNWIRWEKHITAKITNNREAFQAAGWASSFTFYWKYQGDRTKSSRLASWKIQRKLKQKNKEPEPGPQSEPDQETS